jgi:methylaspartate mutase epsilon subunit
VAEAHHIPPIGDNVAAIAAAAAAAAAARSEPARAPCEATDNPVYAQARALVDAVLSLSADVGEGLARAFELGLLDVPYCLHPDNARRSRSYVDQSGWLRWSDVGRMPIARDGVDCARTTASDLLAGLSFVRNRFDAVDTGLMAEDELMTAKR